MYVDKTCPAPLVNFALHDIMESNKYIIVDNAATEGNQCSCGLSVPVRNAIRWSSPIEADFN